MKNLLLILTLLFVAPVYADLTIGTINYSYHLIDRENDFFEGDHKGLFVKYNKYTIGKLVNSDKRKATMFGYSPENYPNWTLGGVTNYRKVPVAPLVAYSPAELKYVNLVISPTVLAIGLKYTFD